MKSEFPLAVIFFSKGDQDDGGIKSILTLLQEVFPKKVFILTNLSHLTIASSTKLFHFPPRVKLRRETESNFVEKIQCCYALVAANIASFKILRKVKPRQIICNDFWSFWHVWLSCSLLRIKILLFVRDTPALGANFSNSWLIPFSFSEKILCLSNELREFILRSRLLIRFCIRIFGTELLVVPSLVKNSARVEARSSKFFAIGYVASFRKKKRQLEFIKNVISPLSQVIPNLRVIFLGGSAIDDTEYRVSCIQEVRLLGLAEIVQFVDHVEDPTSYYCSFDLTCLASSHEGLARSMLESLSCGTPVVSFDVCSAREVLEQHNCGVVVENGNYEKFVAEVVELYHDPIRLAELGDNGMRCIDESYSLPVVRQAIAGLL